MKTCTRCGKEYPLSNFSKSGGKGLLSHHCKQCNSETYYDRRNEKNVVDLDKGEIRSNLLKEVKRQLKAKGITQTALAKAVGVYPHNVTLWVKHDRPPSTPNLIAACQFLGIELPVELQIAKDGRLPLYIAPCAACGTLFPVYKRGVSCCSKKCSGKIMAVRQTGPLNATWKGGKHSTGGGYLMVSRAKEDGGRILEHRLVMQQHLKRKLAKTEYVHHKNGDRHDNRIENLELWVVKGRSKKDPLGQRLEDVLADLLNQPEIQGIEEAVDAAFRRVMKIEVVA